MNRQPDTLPQPSRPSSYPVTSVVVTTSLRPVPAAECRARQMGALLGAPVVPRHGSLTAMCRDYKVTGIITADAERVIYREPERGFQYYYHPGMAKTRLHCCRRGQLDPLLQVLDLHAADTLLDCTLGRASDALIGCWAVGESGRVVGLEKSPVIAALTIDGLAHYHDSTPGLTECLRRIEGHWADYHSYLAACPDQACEVVYFDPLFHTTVPQAQAMAALRELADPAPLTAEAVAQAVRVARRRVVIKQRRGTPLWHELGITVIEGSRSGRVEYGIITS